MGVVVSVVIILGSFVVRMLLQHVGRSYIIHVHETWTAFGGGVMLGVLVLSLVFCILQRDAGDRKRFLWMVLRSGLGIVLGSVLLGLGLYAYVYYIDGTVVSGKEAAVSFCGINVYKAVWSEDQLLVIGRNFVLDKYGAGMWSVVVQELPRLAEASGYNADVLCMRLDERCVKVEEFITLSEEFVLPTDVVIEGLVTTGASGILSFLIFLTSRDIFHGK